MVTDDIHITLTQLFTGDTILVNYDILKYKNA